MSKQRNLKAWQAKAIEALREMGGANCHALAYVLRVCAKEAGETLCDPYAIVYRWKKQGRIVGTGARSAVGEVFVAAGTTAKSSARIYTAR